MRPVSWILAIVLPFSAGLWAPLAEPQQGGKQTTQITITSPSNGTVLASTSVDVVVSFSGSGGARVDSIELRVNGSAAATRDIPRKTESGIEVFSGVDLSAYENSGTSVSLVARAYHGPNPRRFVDSTPVLVTVGSDQIPPVISSVLPANGSATNNPRPSLSARITDAGGSGLDSASIALTLDGAPVTATVVVVNPNEATVLFTPSVDLASGSHGLTIGAKDRAGNVAPQANSTFLVDVLAPAIVISAPAAALVTQETVVALSASVTDAGGAGVDLSSVAVTLDGAVIIAQVTASDPNTAAISFIPPALSDGTHVYTVDAKDRAGNPASTASRSFTVVPAPPVDSIAPVVSDLQPGNGNFTNGAQPTLSAVVTDAGGSGLDPASVVVVLNGIQVPATLTLANPDAGTVSYALNSPLAEGTQGFTVTVGDLALNISATAGSSFVVDVTPPGLMVVSPVPSPEYSTTAVSLQVSAQDALSGIEMNGFLVLVNGVDVTSAVTKLAGANNAFGIPGSAQLVATITGAAGVNSLSISGTDPAGNHRTVTSTFSIASSGGGGGGVIHALPISLQIVQSPDPTGLVGRAASKSMKVKVLSGGVPAKGVPVTFAVTQGDGMITYDATLKTYSDGAGMVGARLVLGDLPGPNAVKASVTLDQEVSVTFNVTGQPPTITEVGGFGGDLSEFPGSAVGQLVTVKAVDPSGQPLKGQVVQPVSEANAATFLPSRAITDADGQAQFAVVISPGAEKGKKYLLEFRLRDFLDAGGNIVKVKKDLFVRDDDSFRYHMVASGQSQISAPKQTLSQVLEVVQGPAPNADRAAVYFYIQEGHGELSAAYGNVQGVFFDLLTARVIGILMERVDGHAGVRYKAGPKAELALIGVGTSDYFAVGIPEVSITRQRFQTDASGTLVLDSGGEPIPVLDGQGNPIYDEIEKSPAGTISSADIYDRDNAEQSVSADQKFYIEAKVAKQGSANAVARLKSLDFCREDLTANGGFAEVRNEIPFVTTEERDTYAIKRSRAIVATGEMPFDGATPSQPATQLQNGDYVIQSVSLGYMVPKVVFEAGTEDESEVQGAADPVFEDIVVLLFDLDGVGRDAWEKALFLGYMPNIKTLTGAGGFPGATTYGLGMSFDSYTDFPAITLPAHASLYTGARISEHKFAGNEWWDRTDQTYFAYGEGAVPRRAKQNLVSALTMGNFWLLAGFSDELTMEQGGASKYLKKQVIWQDAAKAKVAAVSNFTIFNEGAFKHNYPSVGQLLAIESSMPKPGEIPTDQKAHDIARQVDDVITNAAMGSVEIRRIIGMGKAVQQRVEVTYPNLVGVYYPGPDSATHMGGESVGLPYMNMVDQNVFRVYNRLTEVQKRKAVLVFVSDHGHMDTERDANHMVALYHNDGSLNGGVSEIPETGPMLAAPLLAAGYTDPLNTYVEAMEPGNDSYDHVVTNADGGVVYIYLKNRSTQSWGAPRFQEDVLAVAEQIRLAMNQAGTQPLTLQGKIDKILVRDGPGSPYQVYLNQGSVVNAAVGLPEGEKYFRVADRLSTLSSERTGDIVLLLQTDPAVKANRYYSEQPQKSQHGWLTRKDGENTFVIAGPDIPNFKARLQKVIQKSLRTNPPHISDMYRVVRNLLGF